ncbi:trypsin alpha-4-like [Photinus pyralis]|uniref:trypsin alpha-4-like n=1 Tax=Photinus pyralis TaxID=7054 RepID=UPI0012671FE2|nr:trypsin alpha-4-like [Photinus pyralis]
MFKLILVSALFALAAARPKIRTELPQLDGRIVGGFDAFIEQLPYQVSLLVLDSHMCGGSIIRPDLVLTAAHCTSKYQPSEMSVRYGSSIRDQAGTVVPVLYKKDHYEYDPSSMDYDISVLVLVDQIIMSASAQVIPLASSYSEGGRVGLVSGWGALSTGGPSPSQLKAVYVREVDRKKCNDDYEGAITERMICFMDTGKDACQGDSGGPLVSSNGELIGIVSWGMACADPSHPGIYSNVVVLRSFIGW